MARLLVIFVALASRALYSQSELTMTIQAGHASSIICGEVSGDGKYFISSGDERDKTIVWDVKTGRQIVELNYTPYLFIFPDNKRFLMKSTAKDQAQICELPSGRILETFKEPIFSEKKIRLSQDGRFLIGGVMYCFDLETNQTVYEECPPELEYLSLEHTVDGKFFFEPNGNSVALKSAATKATIRTFPLKTEPYSISSSSDGKMVLITTWAGQGLIFNINTGELIRTFGKAQDLQTTFGCFLPDGKTFIMDNGGESSDASGIKIWSISDNKQPLKKLGGNLSTLSTFVFDERNPHRFLTIDETKLYANREWKTKGKALHIWDLSVGRIVKTIPLKIDYWHINKISFRGDTIIGLVAASENHYFLYDLANGKKLRDFNYAQYTAGFHVGDISRCVVVKQQKEYPGDFLGVDAIDIQTGKILYSHPKEKFINRPSHFTDDLRHGLVFNEGRTYIYNMETATLLQEIAAPQEVSEYIEGNWYVQVGAHGSYRGKFKLFEIGSTQPFFSADHETYGRIRIADLSASHRYCVTTRDDGKIARIWEVSTNRLLEEIPSPDGQIQSAIFSPDETKILISDKHLYDLKEHRFLPVKNLSYDGFSSDGKFLLSSGESKATFSERLLRKFHAINDNAEFSVAGVNGYNSDFVIFTPEGYYMTTKNGTKNVHYVKDGKVYLFDQFDIYFNRPDLILRRMGYADAKLIESYKKAFDKRRKKLGVAKEDFKVEELLQVPQVQITSNVSVPASTAKTYSLTFDASDPSSAIERVNVWVNGVPVFGKNGLPNAARGNNYHGSFTIDLNSGLNKIEVSVTNALGVESLKESFDIRYTPAVAVKPDLYVVSIGISDFKDDAYDLTYAAKDAKDIGSLYKNKIGLFGKVNVMALTDSTATLENILKTKATLRKTKPDDVVLLFIASHGLLDESLDYYLATQTVDFNNPSLGGLRYEQFESLIDSIPARKRVVFMDACHSGELDKENVQLADAINQPMASVKSRGFKSVVQKDGVGLENSFELMHAMFADLRKGTGAVVISSASGSEFAFESSQWKNGVFTYSLLEGLSTGKCDSNKDKVVNISELKSYVTDRVVELTNGKQHPTSRSENYDLDFVVW